MPCGATPSQGAHVSYISRDAPRRAPRELYSAPVGARISRGIARKMRPDPLSTSGITGRPGGTRSRAAGRRTRTGRTSAAPAFFLRGWWWGGPKKRGRLTIHPPARFCLRGRLAIRRGHSGVAKPRIRSFSFWVGMIIWSFAKARTICRASDGTRRAGNKVIRHACANSRAISHLLLSVEVKISECVYAGGNCDPDIYAARAQHGVHLEPANPRGRSGNNAPFTGVKYSWGMWRCWGRPHSAPVPYVPSGAKAGHCVAPKIRITVKGRRICRG